MEKKDLEIGIYHFSIGCMLGLMVVASLHYHILSIILIALVLTVSGFIFRKLKFKKKFNDFYQKLSIKQKAIVQTTQKVLFDLMLILIGIMAWEMWLKGAKTNVIVLMIYFTITSFYQAYKKKIKHIET